MIMIITTHEVQFLIAIIASRREFLQQRNQFWRKLTINWRLTAAENKIKKSFFSFWVALNLISKPFEAATWILILFNSGIVSSRTKLNQERMIWIYLYKLESLIFNSAWRDDDIVFRNGINWRNILIFLLSLALGF